MATLQKVQIFPAIGIARIGNSAEWYLGPELPFPAPAPVPPGGTYKDSQCRIKRQAQRFRLWGFYSDGSDRELTTADGDITWTVHLANAKPKITNEGTIDGGLQTLHGPGASASFTGTFAGVPVPLGQAQTDAEGRLIVIGGFGKSENPTDPNSQPQFPYTVGWYDDVSDGPVTARITIGGTDHDALNGAWVICPPPRFAPTSYAITSLYDTLRQLAITKAQLPPPGPPVFTTDVYPILQRALGMRWVTAFNFNAGVHDTLSAFAPPGGPGDTLANRQFIYSMLRPGGNMPLLNDGENSSQLAAFQNTFMQQWSNNQVNEDWPPAVPDTLTPDGLTRAALENCIGAAFYPGIEAGGIPNAPAKNILDLPFVEPFRPDQSLAPGDLTMGMARPWQCDFMLCSGAETPASSGQAAWWPSARPIGIYPADDIGNKRLWTLGIAASPAEMVSNWSELGFIVDEGLGKAVEVEKTNVCKNCFIITDRNEIGKDEAQALIDSGEKIKDAFFVVVQGLAPFDLGITSTSPLTPPLAQIAPQIAPASIPSGMTITVTDVAFENSANVHQVQRVTFGYEIGFTNTSAFTAEDVQAVITATIAELSGSATFDLTLQPHPYMVDGPTSWLSADTRVFKLQPGGMFAQQTLQNDPNGFIKNVIDSLRGSAQAGAWFDALPADEAGAQLEWSQTLNGTAVYNFAICRVRYRAETLPATNVRVFFRLFPAMTTGTDYQPNSTYRTGGQPGSKIPLLGVVAGEITTIPFFAEPRQPAAINLNLQQDPKNVDAIAPDAQGHETYGYFGCWLDINQPGDKRFPIAPTPLDGGPFTGPAPLQSIADLIRGVHQCLVAEIAFDSDPILAGASTGNSDKLAQRNLSIDHSDNPGSADTHRVQHTFTIRPTDPKLAPKLHADELMIRWGATPAGTLATLYLPSVSGAEIIRQADRLYSRHSLTLADPHSVRMRVTGEVTYVPVPAGAAGDLAGLLTVDLPPTVRKGQTFRVIVRQFAEGAAARSRPLSEAFRSKLRAAAARKSARRDAVLTVAASTGRTSTPRRILGAFQFSILVRTAPEIIPGIHRAFVNLQRANSTIPGENRWAPVMERYLQQITARLKAFGGAETHERPGRLMHVADDGGHGLLEGRDDPRHATSRFEGKVAGIRFDRFGDFEGFVLDTPDGPHDFFSRQPEMETLASKAWRERIAICVMTRKHAEHEPLAIVLLRPPS